MTSELIPIGFPAFGGLRLDQAIDEVGPDNAIFLRDVDWDGSLGKLRSRDGFQKLKAADATGPYKGLFPHSATRLLAVKRVKSSEVKLVAVDREGTEKISTALNENEGKSTFAHIGTPSASYSFFRTTVAAQKVVRFDGTEFKEPTIKFFTAANVEETGKKFPCGTLMVGWPDAGNVLVVANTSATGGPKEIASSNSHVWFSIAGEPESFRELDFAQLSPGDGEEITALVVWGGQLYVFKETKFFVFSPPTADEEGKPNWGEAFREVSLGEGSRMKRATASLQAETSDVIATAAPTGVFFCTTDGIYTTIGGPPSKISQALKPLEETVPFEGPMAEFLNGESESFRWPATGIVALGQRIIARRSEFMFVYDLPTEAWTCWKMPAVSMTVWTGLTGGGAESSLKLPGTAEDSNAVGTKTWSNVNNIKAEDGACASVFLNFTGPQSHYLKATNFGFSVPEGATVKGVVVEVRKKASLSAVSDIVVKLIKGGSVQGANKAVSFPEWPLTLSSTSYGGSEDLWESTLAPSDLNASNFGVAISCLGSGPNVEAEVDVVKITVYYVTAESASGVRPRLFCSQSKSIFYTSPSATEQSTYRKPEWQSGFYDLESDGEKTLELMKVWGKGKLKVAVAGDLREVEEPLEFNLGETLGQDQDNKTQTATLFSHRISGEAPWTIHRIVRFNRETRVAGTDSDP